MSFLKKLLFSIIFALICTNLTISSHALSAHSAIVTDAESGRILFSHNAENKMGMASTTKIMTAIAALENADINSVATVSKTAYGVEGSSMYLVLGEKLTLENLLYGLMLVSGNDAATAIAEHVSGSVDGFAELMNKKAIEIGALNSNFTNPHGLTDENHYTTALDLARITAYGLKIPKFKEIVSTKTKSIPWKDHDYNRKLVNHNKMLSLYEGCIGVKTGFTKATGRCLVTAVEKNGMSLICVTLNAPDDWNDHRELYNSVFSTYHPHLLKTKSDILGSATVKGGTKKTVNLVAEKDIYLPIKDVEESNIDMVCEVYEEIEAPIKKGDVLGKLIVKTNNKNCGEFPLCSAEDVELKRPIFISSTADFAISLKKVFNSWFTCFN